MADNEMPKKKRAAPRVYAVARGHRTGIFDAWDGPDGAQAATCVRPPDTHPLTHLEA